MRNKFIQGNPDIKELSTSYIERQNLKMATGIVDYIWTIEEIVKL
ncbi:MAG: hypothetical protein ACLPVI_01340 [Dehalococcoidales bacterium]